MCGGDPYSAGGVAGVGNPRRGGSGSPPQVGWSVGETSPFLFFLNEEY